MKFAIKGIVQNDQYERCSRTTDIDVGTSLLFSTMRDIHDAYAREACQLLRGEISEQSVISILEEKRKTSSYMLSESNTSFTFEIVEDEAVGDAVCFVDWEKNDESGFLHVHPGAPRIVACYGGSGRFYYLTKQGIERLPLSAGVIIAYELPHTLSSGPNGLREGGYHRVFTKENFFSGENTRPHLREGNKWTPDMW